MAYVPLSEWRAARGLTEEAWSRLTVAEQMRLVTLWREQNAAPDRPASQAISITEGWKLLYGTTPAKVGEWFADKAQGIANVIGASVTIIKAGLIVGAVVGGIWVYRFIKGK